MWQTFVHFGSLNSNSHFFCKNKISSICAASSLVLHFTRLSDIRGPEVTKGHLQIDLLFRFFLLKNFKCIWTFFERKCYYNWRWKNIDVGLFKLYIKYKVFSDQMQMDHIKSLVKVAWFIPSHFKLMVVCTFKFLFHFIRNFMLTVSLVLKFTNKRFDFDF